MSRLIRVCAATTGVNAPSSRFRVRQHIGALHEHGVDVTEYSPRVPQAMPMPGPLARVRRRYLAPITAAWLAAHAVSRLPVIAASRAADLVWLERTFVPGMEWVAGALAAPIVLDIDDAVWLEGLAGRQAPGLARRATAAIAGNTYLADWLSQYCRRVHVVPTAVDCARIDPAVLRQPHDGLVIGWTGTSGNFRYLETIAPALRIVLAERPGASLLVVADRAPDLPALGSLPIRFVAWSPRTEIEVLGQMDIGLMPLVDDAWTRGKCSFKMLQYMAAGVPSVVSPVGMNRDVLAQGDVGLSAESIDEWVATLRRLAADPDLRARLGAGGRAVALAHYDVPVVAAHLADVFRSVAPR